MNYKKTQEAYTKILNLVKKFNDSIIFDYKDLEYKSKCHLFGIELKEKYGMELNPEDIKSLNYSRLGDYVSLGMWGEKHRRTISWSDNGEQPEDELLLCLSFSTGAYIVGSDYPTEIFKEFFQELKTYNPKYTDTANNNLYFSMDNAGKIFNEFPAILKKYREKSMENRKYREIKELEEKLVKLKNK